MPEAGMGTVAAGALAGLPGKDGGPVPNMGAWAAGAHCCAGACCRCCCAGGGTACGTGCGCGHGAATGAGAAAAFLLARAACFLRLNSSSCGIKVWGDWPRNLGDAAEGVAATGALITVLSSLARVSQLCRSCAAPKSRHLTFRRPASTLLVAARAPLTGRGRPVAPLEAGGTSAGAGPPLAVGAAHASTHRLAVAGSTAPTGGGGSGGSSRARSSAVPCWHLGSHRYHLQTGKLQAPPLLLAL